MEHLGLIEKLCTGYSTQSKTANQFWLVLIISSIIALTGYPVAQIGSTDKLIKLPFTLGDVNPIDFYSISAVLVSVLLIAFDSAMIQAIRTRMLIQKCIEDLDDKFIDKVHIQDYIDSTLMPTYNRVAPISQFILGKKQFLEDANKQNNTIKFAGIVLYVLLKTTTFILMYFIPLLAVRKCWLFLINTEHHGQLQIPDFILTLIIMLALISTLVLFIGDLKYLCRVIKRIQKKPAN
jgi:hypothetical protein